VGNVVSGRRLPRRIRPASGGPLLLDIFLFGLDFKTFVLDVETKAIVDAHVLVGDPYQSEEGHQVSPPAGIQDLKTRKQEEARGHVVAEAVLAGKYVKELPPLECAGTTGLPLAKFTRLAKDLFVCDRPSDTRNRNTEKKKLGELKSEGLGEKIHSRCLDAGFMQIVQRKMLSCTPFTQLRPKQTHPQLGVSHTHDSLLPSHPDLRKPSG
jgi:hypothetical protein